jgi:hypothetical protein
MNNIGTLVIAPIRPQSTLDSFPSTLANEALGGHHSVATISDRNSIPLARRQEGMNCFVGSNKVTYQLIGGIEDSNWVSVTTLSRIDSLSGHINFVEERDYILDLSASNAYTVQSISAKINEGALAMALKVNATSTSLLNIPNTTTVTYPLNLTVNPGDSLILTISNKNLSPDFYFTIRILIQNT